jgi:serine/threonine-protein kinase
LEYAHNKRGRDDVKLNIVHRDVSPKNIMMTFEGVVKLTDFGIAKALRVMEQDEGEVLMGKVEYMSPEQARYEETDRRCDVFSLGIVMYELMTGHHPFETDDIYDTLENVKTAPVPDPRQFRPDLPEELVQIMMKAMERDLSKRWKTAGEMGYALEYYMYHDRYGPTNVTLGNYLKHWFLGRESDALDEKRVGLSAQASSSKAFPPRSSTETESRIRNRAETVYGDLLTRRTTDDSPTVIMDKSNPSA